MRGKNLVKIATIAGFILAEIYMVWVVLAPYSPGKASRMFVPEYLIPKEPGVAPGTQPPMKVTITRLAVCAVFFGPFGAMAGCGVGLLLEGLRQKLQSRRPGGEKLPPARLGDGDGKPPVP